MTYTSRWHMVHGCVIYDYPMAHDIRRSSKLLATFMYFAKCFWSIVRVGKKSQDHDSATSKADLI